MGTEYAPFREWDYDDSLEWFMLDYPAHKSMQEYVKALNGFYLSRSELWEQDFTPLGFSWILPDENEKNIVAYRRINTKGDSVVVVINFSGAEQHLRLPLCKSKHLERLFSTDYETSDMVIPVVSDSGNYYVDLKIPKFSGCVFKEKSFMRKIKI